MNSFSSIAAAVALVCVLAANVGYAQQPPALLVLAEDMNLAVVDCDNPDAKELFDALAIMAEGIGVPKVGDAVCALIPVSNIDTFLFRLEQTMNNIGTLGAPIKKLEGGIGQVIEESGAPIAAYAGVFFIEKKSSLNEFYMVFVLHNSADNWVVTRSLRILPNN